MFAHLLHRLRTLAQAAAQVLRRRLQAATRPVTARSLWARLRDLVRTKPEIHRGERAPSSATDHRTAECQTPTCTTADRALLVLLASRLRTWRQSLLIVQPDTLLRWHRDLFRRFWRRKSRATAAGPSAAHRPRDRRAHTRDGCSQPYVGR